MPIRYVGTLGAVTGIPELANVVEITFSKPAPVEITFTAKTAPTAGGD